MSLTFVLTLTVVLLAVMLYTIYKMASTGRKRAKGAKKRRKALLPFLYRKKEKFSFS